jgi:hypothetical protein
MSENARTLLQTGGPSPAVSFPLTPLPSVASSFLSPIFSEKLSSTTDSDRKGHANLSSAMNRSDYHPFHSPRRHFFYLFCSITIDLDGDRYVRSILPLTPHSFFQQCLRMLTV